MTVNHQYNWKKFVQQNAQLYDLKCHTEYFFFMFKKNKAGKGAMWYKKRIASSANDFCPRDDDGLRLYNVSQNKTVHYSCSVNFRMMLGLAQLY